LESWNVEDPPLEEWEMEYLGSKAAASLFLFSAFCRPFKEGTISTKSNIPTLHYSNTPWRSISG
jgi:hypothetical protein